MIGEQQGFEMTLLDHLNTGLHLPLALFALAV